MADFNGFTCDVCDNVWPSDVKTREKRSFTGFKPIGDFYRDLCPSCVARPEGLSPVKVRSRKKATNDATLDNGTLVEGPN
jgi:hypothetical protein